MPLDRLEHDRLIQQHADGPSRLKEALAKVPQQAQKWRPGPGDWSAHEIICHCADSETNGAARIRYLVAETEPLIPGYDQDAWAARLDYHSHPLALALATVEAVRANTVALLRRLSDEAWEKVGRHTESGRYAVEDWLKIYAEHLNAHARQIEHNLAAWRAKLPADRA